MKNYSVNHKQCPHNNISSYILMLLVKKVKEQNDLDSIKCGGVTFSSHSQCYTVGVFLTFLQKGNFAILLVEDHIMRRSHIMKVGQMLGNTTTIINK